MTKRVRIIHDGGAMNPRREWDNFGTMVCWHPRYNLGDDQIHKEDAQESVDELPDGSIVLKLYLYDHSGITMSTAPFSCPWDSGVVGYIYVTPEKLVAEYGADSEAITKATKVLEAEIKIYDHYLRGDVWGFILDEAKSCDSCGNVEYEELDSCWGFFGDELEETGITDHIGNEVEKENLISAWEARS